MNFMNSLFVSVHLLLEPIEPWMLAKIIYNLSQDIKKLSFFKQLVTVVRNVCFFHQTSVLIQPTSTLGSPTSPAFAHTAAAPSTMIFSPSSSWQQFLRFARN